MNLMQMKYFMAVCEHGTVSAAAEHLHIAQPSLSMAVKELESEFETVLFNRTHKGMQLTEEGRRFLSICADIVERAESAERTMKDMGQGKKSLRLGVPPMIGSLILPSIYLDFFMQNRDIDIEIVECGGEDAANMLHDGLIDMAFVSHSEDLGADIESVHLDDLEVVCSFGCKSPSIKTESVTPRVLDGVPLVMYKEGFFQSRKIKRWFADGKVEPCVLVTTNQLSTMIKLISSGVAVGFLFDKLVEDEKRIRSVPLDPPMVLKISLAWQKNKFLFSGMKRFKSFVEKNDLLK